MPVKLISLFDLQTFYTFSNGLKDSLFIKHGLKKLQNLKNFGLKNRFSKSVIFTKKDQYWE